MKDPFRAAPDGVRVAVRLTPKASRAGLDGVAVDAAGNAYLRAKVTAVTEKGKANAALINLLAKAWRLPAGDLTIQAGAADRNKTILVAGDATSLLPQLKTWLRQALEKDPKVT